LFSAVTSAFIIDVQSQLQPDTGEESAALLRVLIHKIDNTTFGDNTPTIPQWNGPPHTIVQVQAILYASLAASLFSALLAMLGKQWLNRYASTDVRGTAIERSKNRQRKLDGIVAWYFNHVMELLPLMLQAALLLLGCALTFYLWGINTTIASVVLGVTSSGIIFYIFIIVAGAVSESCPYRTPGSHALLYLWRVLHSVPSALATTFVDVSKRSSTIQAIKECWQNRVTFKYYWTEDVLDVLKGLASDAHCLGRVMIWSITAPLVFLAQRVVTWLVGASSTPEQILEQQTAMLEFRCISWMLQTSLDKVVHLSTFKHLATIKVLTGFDHTLVTGCFNTFLSCVRIGVGNHEVVVVQESEELAMLSAQYFIIATSHLLATDPTSSILRDVHQHYINIFPASVDLHGHQSYHTVNTAHCLLVQHQERRSFWWSNYQPSSYEHTMVAHNLLQIAKFRSQRTQKPKVPCLILRFALHSLSLDPLPPTSVIVDCLSIIAIDLGVTIFTFTLIFF